MARITTVLGDIAPEELGYTSMHDHSFVDTTMAGEHMQQMFPDVGPEDVVFAPENYWFLQQGNYLINEDLRVLDDLDLVAHEYGLFKAAGGNAVCDPTPIGIRVDIRKTQELSRRTGLHFVAATGFYHESSIPPEHLGLGEDHFYRVMRDEVEHGMDGTDAHPGLIKCALAFCEDNEVDALNAAFHLGAETGMLACVHTESTTPADDMVDVLETAVARYDISREKVNICHLDNRIAGSVVPADYFEDEAVERTLDLELCRELLGRGYNIGLDTWGLRVENPSFFMPDLWQRTKALCLLCKEGFAGQITLGDDFSGKLGMRSYGWWGATAFTLFGIERLRELGHDDWVRTLTVETPARLLAY